MSCTMGFHGQRKNSLELQWSATSKSYRGWTTIQSFGRYIPQFLPLSLIYIFLSLSLSALGTLGFGRGEAGIVLLLRHTSRGFSRTNGLLVLGFNDLTQDFRGHKKDSISDVRWTIFASTFGLGFGSDSCFSSVSGTNV